MRTRPTLRDQVIVAAVALAIPLNGIPRLLPAGELASEALFYVGVAAIGLFAVFHFSAPLKLLKSLIHQDLFVNIYIFLCFSSFFLSISSIFDNFYGVRTGLDRFAYSLLTLIYYVVVTQIGVFYMRFFFQDTLMRLLVGAISALGWLLVAINLLQVFGWYYRPIQIPVELLRSYLSVGNVYNESRLTGVSLEPSFNAFALLFCLPFALVGRTKSGLLLALAITLCLILSGARTALVGLCMQAFVGVILSLRSAAWRRALTWAVVWVFFGVGVLLPLWSRAQISPGSSVSDITRTYMMAAAIDGGLQHLFGQGFGQATFFVARTVSSVIAFNWELTSFFRGDRFGELPPLYSWFARSFGEFGTFGYVVLALGFASTAGKAAALSRPTSPLSLVACMLIMQFLATGLSIESVRLPSLWFGLALLQYLSKAATNALPSQTGPARDPQAGTGWAADPLGSSVRSAR